jgi:hypothetical protein
MWIKDLLPDTVPNARLLSFGYDVDTRGSTPISVQSLYEHGKSLAEMLSEERADVRFTTRSSIRLTLLTTTSHRMREDLSYLSRTV